MNWRPLSLLSGPLNAVFKVSRMRRVPSVVYSSPMVVHPAFSQTTLWVGPPVCNRAARRQGQLAATAADAANCAEGARATAEARLLRFAAWGRAGCNNIGERTEELLRARARYVRRGLSKNRRQANRAGPFVGAPIGAEPMVMAAHRRTALVMAELVGEGDPQALHPDLAMAREAAIDPDTGYLTQPERLRIQAIALPRDVDGDIGESDGKSRDDPINRFAALRIRRRPQAF